MPKEDKKAIKASYTVPCSSAFRDAVSDLAARRGVNVADLARSVLLTVSADRLAAFPDPGEPDAGDREDVTLKTGPSKGRPWRRKPRLQIRMPPGQDVTVIRRALNLALSVDRGDATVYVDVPQKDGAGKDAVPIGEIRDEVERLRAVVSALAFSPLPNGVESREDALYVLGFPPRAIPDQTHLRARFRMLATVHHPDGPAGDHVRMSQLNAAMDVLRRFAA
ncbi:MAG: J domain-containing protein [Rhodospirillales bacterium]|nr:J domain-containing protein [Rhodospirillales bacterium]MCW8863173.1 J domain-containing protein [Rhodospirillales bacterium]MCW8952007.1 J domain-containing protein [Rhodospirillales bacterium]MCW8971560.1 J domain-containing protein [Rhodospirillales bacterium]MCW9002280.1 J domain-containing protein [Rhodospirillales bacterium]